MIIHSISDLHLEFGPYDHPMPGGDVLLLPGDILAASHVAMAGNKDMRDKYPEYMPKLDAIIQYTDDFFARACAAHDTVLAVAGNHEHYGMDVAHTLRVLSERYCTRHKNLDWLEKEAVVIDNHMFFGATLWTDFNGNDVVTRRIAAAQMNDYRQIYITEPDGHQRRITPEDIYEDHLEAVRALQAAKSAAIERDMRLVVMTHHAPSRKSRHPRYANQYHINGCYQTDLEHLMDDTIPLWVHGHTHDSYDYTVNGTRNICNSRGYTGDNPAVNWRFDPKLEIIL